MNPAQSYYRALALRKLGRSDEAKAALQQLLASANQALQNPEPRTGGARGGRGGRGGPQSRQSPLLQAHYAAGLGHLGLGEDDQAKEELRAALAINPAHVAAKSALDSLNRQ